MVYKKLSNQQLSEFKYPNLIAELIESGYSICTCSDHMGVGRRQENDQEIWDKLKGKRKMSLSEAKGLALLFNVKFEYLFSRELNVMNEKPYAYIRWYEWNKKQERDEQLKADLMVVERTLKDKPYLLQLIKTIKDCDEKDCEAILKNYLKKIA